MTTHILSSAASIASSGITLSDTLLVPTWQVTGLLTASLTLLTLCTVGMCYATAPRGKPHSNKPHSNKPRSMSRTHHHVYMGIALCMLIIDAVAVTGLLTPTAHVQLEGFWSNTAPMYIRIFASACILTPVISYLIMLVDHTQIPPRVTTPQNTQRGHYASTFDSL